MGSCEHAHACCNPNKSPNLLNSHISVIIKKIQIFTPLLRTQGPAAAPAALCLSALGWAEPSRISFVQARGRCSSHNRHIHWQRKGKAALGPCTSEFHLRRSGTEDRQGGAGRNLGPGTTKWNSLILHCRTRNPDKRRVFFESDLCLNRQGLGSISASA